MTHCDRCISRGRCSEEKKCYYDWLGRNERALLSTIERMSALELNQAMEQCIIEERYEECRFIKREMDKRIDEVLNKGRIAGVIIFYITTILIAQL